ncbi:MAG: DUF333 domain-containing protein [Candidatus Pacebacteria bacterium]|nr:DUF333 domain-containing protein [Candidatus Paceibacterota bacterium]
MKKIILEMIVVVLVVIGALYLYKNSTVKKPTEGVINQVTFYCAENKTIQAIFFSEKVELTLSDGRNMLLPQAVSASGARYTNSDESFVFWNKGDTAFVNEGDQTTFKDCGITKNDQTPAQIANPASVNCSKVGGTLTIEKRGDGGEYGLCYFADNRACEEWALYRGDCPLGGVKTTGYDGIDQKYCAWSGGQTFAVSDSVCTFKDGSKCPTADFYNGKCPVQ